MKKVALISKFSGIYKRGVESWAEELKSKLGADINPKNIFDYDIVVPTNGREQVLFYRILTWLTGKKMVVFGHSGPGADDKWNLWCCPDMFVTFSNTQMLWANKFKYPWTKTKVIYHAVDTNVFKPDKNIKKDVDVLCVAANSPEKRVDLVRKAWGDVLVVGSGQENEFNYSEMPKIYNKAKVFCFVPWEREAFGLVFLEAMACNLPVVTIDDPTRREIVGEVGIFVKDPQNTQELSQAIKTVLNKKWGQKPQDRAMHFSWSKIKTQYEELFNNI